MTPSDPSSFAELDAYFRAANFLTIAKATLRHHSAYVREHFEDVPAIRDFRWSSG